MKMTPFIEGPVLDFSPEESNGQGNGLTGNGLTGNGLTGNGLTGNGLTGSKEECLRKILYLQTVSQRNVPKIRSFTTNCYKKVFFWSNLS
jgi:hypothetical protein